MTNLDLTSEADWEKQYVRYAGVTQWLECDLAKVDVEGSNPFTRFSAAPWPSG